VRRICFLTIIISIFAGTFLNAQTARECCAKEWEEVIEVMKEDYPHLTRVKVLAIALKTEQPSPSIEINCLEIDLEVILCRLYVTEAMIIVLTAEEFLAVIAHEIGHVANKDFETEDPTKRSFTVEKRADRFALVALKRLSITSHVFISALEKLTPKDDMNAQKEKKQRIETIKLFEKNRKSN